mmetsp:Transcript_90256/g.264010  ORF Transcript_90256/g.264010 Transcript_90256/m.264010 type:complete len:187 (+) Transcript_90256:100-660(+)
MSVFAENSGLHPPMALLAAAVLLLTAPQAGARLVVAAPRSGLQKALALTEESHDHSSEAAARSVVAPMAEIEGFSTDASFVRRLYEDNVSLAADIAAILGVPASRIHISVEQQNPQGARAEALQEIMRGIELRSAIQRQEKAMEEAARAHRDAMTDHPAEAPEVVPPDVAMAAAGQDGLHAESPYH